METELEMYELKNAKDRNLFKNKSGIYGLIHQGYNKEEVIYVGQSKNLANRLGDHSRPTSQLEKVISAYVKENGRSNRAKQMGLYRFLECNIDDVFFVVLKETEDLNEWEEHYITLFKPAFNYKGVDVPYKEKEKPQ